MHVYLTSQPSKFCSKSFYSTDHVIYGINQELSLEARASGHQYVAYFLHVIDAAERTLVWYNLMCAVVCVINSKVLSDESRTPNPREVNCEHSYWKSCNLIQVYDSLPLYSSGCTNKFLLECVNYT